MNKTVSVLALLCMLMVSLAVPSFAQTVEPIMPDALRELVSGKTFIARMDGFASDENMERANMTFQICEQETYKAAEVEALQEGDVILTGGDEFRIVKISQDEFGYELTGEWNTLYLYKNDAGLYYAVNDTENRFYKNLFAVEVPSAADFRFLDWTDPEAEEPTVLTLKDLLTRYLDGEINSSADNTEVTFNEEGKVSEIVYRYSPWN